MTAHAQRRQVLLHRRWGVACGILSALCYGTMSFVVHAWSAGIPSTEIIFFRSVVSLLIFFPLAWRRRQELLTKSASFLWGRSLFGALSTFCFVWALQHTSIGMANVLFNLAPIGVGVFTWLNRSEGVELRNIVCLILVTAGSAVFWGIGKPPTLLVFCIGLGSALAAAVSYVLLKHAATQWDPIVVTWAMSLVSLPLSVILKDGHWMRLSSASMPFLILVAVLCTIGQVCLSLAYRWVELSTASAIVPSCMAWGVLLDSANGTLAGLHQIAGCLFYLAGAVPLMLQNVRRPQTARLNSQPESLSPLVRKESGGLLRVPKRGLP